MYGKKSRGSKILATRGRGDFVKFYLAPPKWLLPLKCLPPQIPRPGAATASPPSTFHTSSHYELFVTKITALQSSWSTSSKRIMERASKHCINARTTICHGQIKTLKLSIRETNINLASLLQPETYQAFSQLLNT